MNNGARALMVALVLALGLVIVNWGKSQEHHPQNAAPQSSTRGAQPTQPVDVSPKDLAQPSVEPTSLDTPTGIPRYQRPVRDPQRAALVREALIAQKATQLGATENNAMPPPEGHGNQVGKPMGRYINRVMQEQFVPMATQCYENLLAAQPSLAGNVQLEFSILGDPSVGGVVVDVNLGTGTTLTDPAFRTCMTESMFAVVFDAPPGEEGSVSVVQSFELAP